MPRPTPAQLAYGSATVICSTLAMLLLSQASSPAGVVSIAVAGLALGVLVALTLAMPWGTRPTSPPRSSGTPEAARRVEHSLHR